MRSAPWRWASALICSSCGRTRCATCATCAPFAGRSRTALRRHRPSGWLTDGCTPVQHEVRAQCGVPPGKEDARVGSAPESLPPAALRVNNTAQSVEQPVGETGESHRRMAHTPTHAHIAARRVLIALTVTVLAAAVELVGSARGNTLFLAADACHLLAHVGIFGVLLIPTGQWHDRGEDVAATAVLTMVALIAVGIAVASVQNL